MPGLLSIAHVPPTTVTREATVKDVVRRMVENRVGAAAVVDGERLLGIFTERDLMKKVVDAGLDPAATRVAQVMTSPVEPIAPDERPGQALRLMSRRHIRHLPVCDQDGRVLGMLSIRNLLQQTVEKLSDELDSLESFIAADGPGG